MPNRTYKAFVVCVALALVIGCSTDGGGNPPSVDTPNVYQPPTKAEKCSEIQYEYESESGTKNDFYLGQGAFCAHLDRIPGTPMRARCVERDSSREIINSGGWVDYLPAKDYLSFLSLCPGAEPPT